PEIEAWLPSPGRRDEPVAPPGDGAPWHVPREAAPSPRPSRRLPLSRLTRWRRSRQELPPFSQPAPSRLALSRPALLSAGRTPSLAADLLVREAALVRDPLPQRWRFRSLPALEVRCSSRLRSRSSQQVELRSW